MERIGHLLLVDYSFALVILHRHTTNSLNANQFIRKQHATGGYAASALTRLDFMQL